MSDDCIIIESDDEEIAQPSPPASVSSSTDPLLSQYWNASPNMRVPSQSRDFAGVLLQREFARLGIPLPNYGLYNGPNLRQLLDAISAAREELIQNERQSMAEQNVQNVEAANSKANQGSREPIPKLKIKITPKRQTKAAKETKGSKRYKLNEYSFSKSPTTSKRKVESKKTKVPPVNDTPAHYLSQMPSVINNPTRQALYKALQRQEVSIIKNPAPPSQSEQKVVKPGTSRPPKVPTNIISSAHKTISTVTNGRNSQEPLVALVDLIRSVSDTNAQIKNEISSLPQNLMRMRNELLQPQNEANGRVVQKKCLKVQSEKLLNMTKECSNDTHNPVQRTEPAQPQNPFKNVHSAQMPLISSKNSECTPPTRIAQSTRQTPCSAQQEQQNYVHHVVQHHTQIHRQYEGSWREKGVHIVECHPRPISAHGGQSVHMQQNGKQLNTQPNMQAGKKEQSSKLIQQSKLQLFESRQQNEKRSQPNISQASLQQGVLQARQLQFQQLSHQAVHGFQRASLHSQLIPMGQQPAQQVQQQIVQPPNRFPSPPLFQSPQMSHQSNLQPEQQEQQPTTQPSLDQSKPNAKPTQTNSIPVNQESPQAGPSAANHIVQYQPQYPLQQQFIQLPDGRIFLSQYITPNYGGPEQEQNNQALVPVNRPLRLQPVFPLLFYPRYINQQEIGFLYLNRLNQNNERYLPITERSPEEGKQVENLSGQETCQFSPMPSSSSTQNAQPIGVIQGNRSYHDSYRNWVSNNTRNSQTLDQRNRRQPELRHIQLISQMRHNNPPRPFHQFYQQRFPYQSQMRPPFFPVATFPVRPPQPFQGFQQRSTFPSSDFNHNFGYQENPDHHFQQNRWNRGPQ